MKMRYHVTGVENARHEFAAPTCKGGKCETWKCKKRDSMEHRVLHMFVHCRAGMHELTRKSIRFRRQLWVPHLPVWDYHGSESVLVWLWWLEQSSHDVDFQLLTFFLHLHKLCCQLCCTDYTFIIQFCSSYICHHKNNNRQNVTPALKNRFRHWLNAKHNTAFLYNIGRAGRK